MPVQRLGSERRGVEPGVERDVPSTAWSRRSASAEEHERCGKQRAREAVVLARRAGRREARRARVLGERAEHRSGRRARRRPVQPLARSSSQELRSRTAPELRSRPTSGRRLRRTRRAGSGCAAGCAPAARPSLTNACTCCETVAPRLRPQPPGSAMRSRDLGELGERRTWRAHRRRLVAAVGSGTHEPRCRSRRRLPLESREYGSARRGRCQPGVSGSRSCSARASVSGGVSLSRPSQNGHAASLPGVVPAGGAHRAGGRARERRRRSVPRAGRARSSGSGASDVGRLRPSESAAAARGTA